MRGGMEEIGKECKGIVRGREGIEERYEKGQ